MGGLYYTDMEENPLNKLRNTETKWSQGAVLLEIESIRGQVTPTGATSSEFDDLNRLAEEARHTTDSDKLAAIVVQARRLLLGGDQRQDYH